MPSVSAIILTKDSQRTLEACIKALKPAVDHVIVVDTGSTDDTVQIAKENGARVYHFEWCDDFAAARNFGDSLATSDWVIHVDSDEILRPEDTSKIRRLCSEYKKTNIPIAVRVLQINVMDEGVSTSPVTRLYKRNTLMWKGIIHEFLHSKRPLDFHTITSDVGFIHDGYHIDVVNVDEKAMRNIKLLNIGIEQEPQNAWYHYFLGRESTVVNDIKTAIPHLRTAIDLFEQSNQTFRLEHAYVLLVKCLYVTGDHLGAEEIGNHMMSNFSAYRDGWHKALAQP